VVPNSCFDFSFAGMRKDSHAVAGTTPAVNGEVKMNSRQLVYTIAEACAASRSGRTALYEAIRAGALTARKRGRRTLILADDLQRWIEGHPTVQRKPAKK
jgi:excisionase family DNA binding protein